MDGLILTLEQWQQSSIPELCSQLQAIYPESEASQIRSWKSILCDLKSSSTLSSLPKDCVLAMEYSLPTDGMAIDLLFAGLNQAGNPAVCIIEAKQWSDSFLAAANFSSYREPGKELHPQIQISRHRLSFHDYLDIGPSFQVHPFVYMPNASAQALRALTDCCPIPANCAVPILNQIDALLINVGRILVAGTPSMVRTLQTADFSPSKSVIEAMSAISTKEEPFLLTGQQKEAAAQVSAAIDAGYRIIRITGAAGSGKTAILLNLYAQYLREQYAGRLPIFLSGAQNTAYYRSAYPEAAQNFTYSLQLRKMVTPSNGNQRILFMDEAQHNTPGILTNMVNCGAILILCYDVTQVISPYNAIAELRTLAQRPDFITIPLQGSVRFSGSQEAEQNIRQFLKGNTQFPSEAQKSNKSSYDFQIFSNLDTFQNQIYQTIRLHPDRTVAVAGLLCRDAAHYTRPENPHSHLYIDWGSKGECRWIPYVLERSYSKIPPGQDPPDLWVGTWWMPGLDFDYVAVIAGSDVTITKDGIVADPHQSKHYHLMVDLAICMGLPKHLLVYHNTCTSSRKTIHYSASCQQILAFLDLPENEDKRALFIQQFSKYLRNLYYIMMTRGRKGCFAYFANHHCFT